MPDANWRESILKHFQRGTARLTLVSDPDGEGTLTAIKDRGFDVILFEDSIAFRYAYESNYRARWELQVRNSPGTAASSYAEARPLSPAARHSVARCLHCVTDRCP